MAEHEMAVGCIEFDLSASYDNHRPNGRRSLLFRRTPQWKEKDRHHDLNLKTVTFTIPCPSHFTFPFVGSVRSDL